MTQPTIAELPTGTIWYIVSPGDGMSGPKYAGPDRAQAVDRLVALVAQGRDVLPGERFRPRPTDAYIQVAPVDRIGGHAFLGPCSRTHMDEESALLAEAQALLTATRAEEDRVHFECDGCHVRPDGTSEDGTTCLCSIGEPMGGCHCTPSDAEWFGPAYVRAEIAAEEC